MNIEMNEGYNLIYAKIGGRPKNTSFNEKVEVMRFLLNHLNDIDFISINDVIIDKNKLINDNIILGRYLKLKKLYEL